MAEAEVDMVPAMVLGTDMATMMVGVTSVFFNLKACLSKLCRVDEIFLAF